MSDNEEEGGEGVYEQDCEDFEDYKRDGYHPVYLGEKFMNDRYIVLQKLGWGHFSTVWLAEDRQFGQPGSNSKEKYVALKIQKSKESYSEAAQDEIQVLKALKEAKKKPEWAQTRVELANKGLNLNEDDTFCIEILNNFPHFGIHGKHFCSTFHIMGPNLLDLLRFFEKKYKRGVPLFIVKKIAVQLLVGLDYMHRMGGVIHTDLKPENVMLDLPPTDMEQFIQELKALKTQPLSMKYLKSVQSAANKNKKKKKKKKGPDCPSTQAKSDTPADRDSFSLESDVSNAFSAPPKTHSKNPVDEEVARADTSKAIDELEDMMLTSATLKKAPYPTETISAFPPPQSQPKEDLHNNTNTNHTAINEEPLPGKQSQNNNTKAINIQGESTSSQDQSSGYIGAQGNHLPTSFHEADSDLGVDPNAIKNELDQPQVGTSTINGIFGSLMPPQADKQSSSVEIVEELGHSKPKPSKAQIKKSNDKNGIEGDFSKDPENSSSSRSSSSKSSSSGLSEEKSKRKASFEEHQDFTFYWKGKVKVVLNKDIKIKIVDFGNACWTNKHFTDNIQTREYRSPEAIVGSKYDANTDIWSLACMLFELITGDYLFRPHSSRHEPRDELHIALFISTLGKFPKRLAMEGKYSRELFNKNGKLLHAEVPEDYTLDQILTMEYDFKQAEAEQIRDFLLPMLDYDIEKRISAQQALKSPWLWS